METSSDDDDVIFCGEVFDPQLPLESSARARTEQQKKHFLAQNFTLVCANSSDTADSNDVATPSKAKGSSADVESAANEISPGKHRRLPRRTRYVITLAKCPQIPLSSPLGQSLVKSTNANCSPEYANERLERMDRFCHAPPLPPGTGHLLRQQRSGQEPLSVLDRRLPKWLYTKPRISSVPVTYKRPTDEPIEPYHDYKFPRRQFSTKHRWKNYLFYNKPLIQRCKSCSIRLKRMTPSEMRFLIEWPGVERRKREAELAAEQERQRRKEAADRAMIIDSIDLCSSSEEEEDPMVDTTQDVSEAFELASTTPSPVMLDGTTEGTVTSTTVSDWEETNGDDADLETIVLEGDDAEVVPRSNVMFDNPKAAASNGLRRSVGAPMASNPSPFHATLLSERALRLNQSLPTAATGTGVPLVRPMYLYTNCNRTTLSVGGTPGASVADSNRLLKENRVSGWMQNGIAHADVVGNPAPLPAMGQSHTMLLTTPSVRALFPVTFANGSVGVSSHLGGSVVQTLTTTTFANQTVHKRRLSVARTAGPSATVVTGTVAATANLQ
uniref:Uncharacterized protein n=1 Tax=Anopheles atroparvus TaxID=41427 RepID=A0A182JGT5_ANOAO